MEDVLVTSMTTKGQVVIPSDIRSQLNLASGSKFVVVSDGQNILLKPIEKPKMEVFEALLKKSRKIAKDANIKKDDVSKIVKETRRARRS